METVKVNKFRVYPCAFWKGLSRRADLHQGPTATGYDKHTWPPRSSSWCWQCCHPFETVPAFLPVELNLESNTFYLAGNFCSWNCVKAYAFRMEKFRRPDAAWWISLLAFLTVHRPRNCVQDVNESHSCECPCIDKFKGVDMPLLKEELHTFGGSVAIKDYRKTLMTIDNYEWVTTYFHRNNAIKSEMNRLTATQKRRSYVFCLVSYPGPSESTSDQIYVLPLTHRTIPKPKEDQGPEHKAVKPTGRSTARRRGSKGTNVATVGTVGTMGTVGTSTSSNSSSSNSIAPSTIAVENLRVVEPVVSEEHAFYVQSMNKYGNLFTSMGISIEKIAAPK
jgi:hypothetical protein